MDERYSEKIVRNKLDEITMKLIQWSTSEPDDLSDLMKDYQWSLQSIIEACTEKGTIKQYALQHITFIYLSYNESRHCTIEKYLNHMEDILTMYCDLELDTSHSLICANLASKKIIQLLTVYLLERHDHILHVLIKIRDKSHMFYQEVMNMVYRHFLTRVSISMKGDEAFCRNYIVFQKWKQVRRYEDRPAIDDIMYKMFKRRPESLYENECIRKILLLPNRLTADIVVNLFRSLEAISTAYFRHIQGDVFDFVEDLGLSLDLGVDELYASPESSPLPLTATVTTFNQEKMDIVATASEDNQFVVECKEGGRNHNLRELNPPCLKDSDVCGVNIKNKELITTNSLKKEKNQEPIANINQVTQSHDSNKQIKQKNVLDVKPKNIGGEKDSSKNKKPKSRTKNRASKNNQEKGDKKTKNQIQNAVQSKKSRRDDNKNNVKQQASRCRVSPCRSWRRRLQKHKVNDEVNSKVRNNSKSKAESKNKDVKNNQHKRDKPTVAKCHSNEKTNTKGKERNNDVNKLQKNGTQDEDKENKNAASREPKKKRKRNKRKNGEKAREEPHAKNPKIQKTGKMIVRVDVKGTDVSSEQNTSPSSHEVVTNTNKIMTMPYLQINHINHTELKINNTFESKEVPNGANNAATMNILNCSCGFNDCQLSAYENEDSAGASKEYVIPEERENSWRWREGLRWLKSFKVNVGMEKDVS